MCLVAQSCLTLCNSIDCRPPGSSVHGDSSGKNTRVGSHSHLQEIFPTQGSNPGLPHCRWILYHLGNQGSTWILKWVACPYSRGSSQPRNRTGVSCFAGGFFTNRALPGMPNKVVVGNKIIFSLVLVNGLMYTDLFFNDFIYFWLHWVFIAAHGLSLVQWVGTTL